jgi:hypothetical protein
MKQLYGRLCDRVPKGDFDDRWEPASHNPPFLSLISDDRIQQMLSGQPLNHPLRWSNSFFRAFHHWEGTSPGQWRVLQKNSQPTTQAQVDAA